jgi:pyruvate dehydrogenase E1 component alpha subunit
VQLLDDAGELHEVEGYPLDLKDDDFRDLYRFMALARRVDKQAINLQRQGQLGVYASLLGQEAAQVGSAYALRPQDYVFPSYREHGVLHVRGVDPVDRLEFWRGSDHGGWDPNEFHANTYAVVIGTQALHATGYAMGVQRDGAVGTGDKDVDTAVVAYFGDGATSQGDVSEGMVFAAVNQAPVVFFCQNNQWAISEPTTRQTRTPLYRRGEGFGIPSLRVDGNDVLAVYAATQEALDRARSGQGPSLIEAFTYRMGAHTTSDDPTRYRTTEQEEIWRRRDPIARLRTLLTAEGVLDDAFEAEVEKEAEALGERMRSEVRKLEPATKTEMFDTVYATPHSVVAADRAWFEAYESGAVPDGAYASQVTTTPQGGNR